jgi:hypothetical protein
MMVDLLCCWAPFKALAKFGNFAATLLLAWVLSVRGHKGFGWSKRRG